MKKTKRSIHPGQDTVAAPPPLGQVWVGARGRVPGRRPLAYGARSGVAWGNNKGLSIPPACCLVFPEDKRVAFLHPWAVEWELTVICTSVLNKGAIELKECYSAWLACKTLEAANNYQQAKQSLAVAEIAELRCGSSYQSPQSNSLRWLRRQKQCSAHTCIMRLRSCQLQLRI